MSLFNFGSFIEKEIPAKATPKGTIRDPHSLKDLVKKAVEQGKNTQAPIAIAETNPESVLSLPKPVILPELEESKFETKVQAKVEGPVEVASDFEQETTSKESIVFENNTSGTFFLKSMLSEFSDLLDFGNQLNDFNSQRKELAHESMTLEQEMELEVDRKTEISRNLTLMLTEDSDSTKNLQDALESYNKYLDFIKNKYERRESALKGVSSEIALKIEEKKKQIGEMMNFFGDGNTEKGKEVFTKIKEAVTFCKNIRAEKMGESPVSEKLKSEISLEVKNFVENDRHGAQLLTEAGNILGILMQVFAVNDKPTLSKEYEEKLFGNTRKQEN